MQDPNPMTWGAMDRFQAHYIVRAHETEIGDMLARTILATRGRFASKTVVSVSWQGPGHLSQRLNNDSNLNELISRQSVEDATIFVEPVDGDIVRIHGKWKNHLEFGVTPEMFHIYDMIAGHIKHIQSRPATSPKP